ncbi:MAG: arginine--tRNA ligase [Prevotellaceae bacterium]|nr:arginine--tRNA ligase [Prevotellaceae bacterium]
METGKITDAKSIIKSGIAGALGKFYGVEIDDSMIQIYKTRRDFEGDYTLFAFPFAKISKKSPEQAAIDISGALSELNIVDSVNTVKAFVNIKMKASFWAERLTVGLNDANFGQLPRSGQRIMLEYSSPNTNKPLHLGHIRNNLLGWSVAKILEACGHEVIKVNLVNDRGIHICKSMVAWQQFGAGETPQSSGKKGDHLVGEYYVKFDREYKAQQKSLIENSGVTEAEAAVEAPIFAAAREMLRKWEAGDEATVALWKTMNGWVYEGFDATYRRLGVAFDKIYYESDTWILGKKIVEEGLSKGIFYRKDDSSVWIDLTADGLDAKLLLRSDGTTVYMTQDLGTAEQRYEEYGFDKLIYVVGNEQNYHFQALRLILNKLGHRWAEAIYHLSYGMVELPEGKMKSREGTVVDADDLIAEMQKTAREVSDELGKLNEMSETEAAATVDMIALGALKYYILKVDPKKTMLFDPKESIDFNGNTASFIQYTHARICSVLRKHGSNGFLGSNSFVKPSKKEIELIKLIEVFPETVRMAGDNLSPALIANCVYELAKEYNQFYHDYPILKEENAAIKNLRLALSYQVALTIKNGMALLGIDVPEKM